MKQAGLILVVALLLAACGSRSAPAGAGDSGGDAGAQADITGTVTRAGEMSIVVEENPRDTSGSAKASVRITSATVITSASGTPPELRPGRRVSVWFSGPVAESYPMQATASKIVVHE